MHHKGLLILQKKNSVIMKMILITLLVLESPKKEKKVYRAQEKLFIDIM